MIVYKVVDRLNPSMGCIMYMILYIANRLGDRASGCMPYHRVD